jgi:glucose-1-phosphate thymidylyltransferase
VQDQPAGTANAVLCAETWVQDEAFLVMNGDNLYPVEVIRRLASSAEPALPGFDRDELVSSGNIEASRVSAFALIELDDRGYLARIVEKPQPGDVIPHALVSMNCWRFDRRIFDACREVPRSPRGEYELPLAVGVAVRNGVRFKVLPARGPVLDLSQRADAAEVSRRLSGVLPHP